jgi:hypothetical protein
VVLHSGLGPRATAVQPLSASLLFPFVLREPSNNRGLVRGMSKVAHAKGWALETISDQGMRHLLRIDSSYSGH